MLIWQILEKTMQSMLRPGPGAWHVAYVFILIFVVSSNLQIIYGCLLLFMKMEGFTGNTYGVK
jgi:hypothetical protein